MNEITQFLIDIVDWSIIFKNLGLIVCALVFTLPIAYNRETKSQSAGLRTYPLVAVATCSYTLLALDVLGGSDSMGKYMAGIVTGIGFIGGGAILKAREDEKVLGLANAATIWNTGAIGMAVAWQRFEIALIIAVINLAILRVGFEAKKAVCDEDEELEN
ncbi:MgtC/SapB family protein [Marinicella sp. S1101]|uniref:MgtC/SapB family protein n=1 Tax=Marinicella marina TaxID=2996016 RepID=UPI002260E7AE|nr:MgtC/SapB family protein [Marinicella marina]MCX7552919.1 MgtC/SapB family protein [Marinicella marina]MDJ1139772.1 MgtC/SapB family protein [Marinicella marina]